MLHLAREVFLAKDPDSGKTAGGTVDGLVKGLAPDWGPFAQIGGTARTVIQAIMAAVILVLLGRALLGLVHLRVGNSQHDTVQVKQGQKELAGSLVAAFVVASLGTLFTIVYGMGI